MGDYLVNPGVPTANIAHDGKFGNRFTVDVQKTYNAASYYRSATNINYSGSKVEVWDVDQNVIVSQAFMTASGPVGWEQIAIPAFTADPTHTYIACIVGGVPTPYWGWPSAPPGIGPNFNHIGVRYGGGSGYPPNVSSWEVLALDLHEGGGGPPPPPPPPEDPPDTEPDPGTLDPGGSLPYWLHQNTANPDSAPKLTLDLIKQWDADDRASILAIVTSIGLPAPGFVGTMWTRFLSVLDKVQLAIDATNVVKGVADYIVTQVEGLAGGISGIASGGRPVADVAPTLDPGYVLTDTLVGQGAKAWLVPADRYILTITNPEALTAGIVIDGIPYWRHRGWWAPLEVDLVGAYYNIAGIKHVLYESGRRLPGVLLYVEPHIEWTLEALDYVPPAP